MPEPTAETVEARVARGAAWLDSEQPGWERRIDLATLDLQDSCRCVLGQVFGTELHHDGFRWALSNLTVPAVIGLGFDEPPFAAPSWEELDEAWIALLKERFDTGSLSDA